jgi:endonuclease YncB( thermonuclease family)
VITLTVHDCFYAREFNGKTKYHDGDTFRCYGDVRAIIPDSHVWMPKVRLAKTDAPEEGKEGWDKARDMLIDWLELGHFDLICFGRDKFGRLLADAQREDGLLSAWMLSDPDVSRYMTPVGPGELLRRLV